MFKDNTRPGDTAMPDEIYGSTGALDRELKTSLNTKGHPTFAIKFDMKPMSGQAININLKSTRVACEASVISIEPSNKALAQTIGGKQGAIALPGQIDRDL